MRMLSTDAHPMRLCRLVTIATLACIGPVAAQDQFEVTETRIFSAPPQAVWAAWSEAEQIRKWWGPTGFEAPVADMDFREGGTTLVCMQAPSTPLMCNTWRYTRLVPYELIEFDAGWADENGATLDPAAIGLPAGIPAIVPHRVILSPHGDTGTQMTIEEYGYGTQEAAALSHAGLVQVLDKMEAAIDD